jgi:outer membrane protein assembly factor BamE (lipoprotein component of BamABCDE complex)
MGYYGTLMVCDKSMRGLYWALLFPWLFAGLAGCSIVYKLPTRQGNVIEQKQLDQLQLGMTKEQVQFLLGTPIATDPFRDDRWDYLGYYKSPRGEVSSRTVTLFFDDGKLIRMKGVQLAANDKAAVPVDVETLAQQRKKDQTDQSRDEAAKDKQTGVAIPAP